MEYKRQRSKTAVVITGFYLLAVMASVLILFATADETAMSGIFLVFVTMPWPLVLTRIQEVLPFDSMMGNGLFLLAGGLFNGFIIYKLLSFMMNILKR